MPDLSLTAAYQYELPEELIARVPLPDRAASRMLVLDRRRETIGHQCFRELPGLLQPGDLLVINESKVLPARLLGVRVQTGGRWEGLYLGHTPQGDWKIIGQTRGKLQPGERVRCLPAEQCWNRSTGEMTRSTDEQNRQQDAPHLELVLLSREEEGVWIARPQSDQPARELLEQFGTMPLPPYLGRKVATREDVSRYQTTYATQLGSIAAPTAGLHFTPELLDRCREQGVELARVTLHVGLGTFRPVESERLDDHRMHTEWCEVPTATHEAIQQTRRRGGRVVAVGTTTVRTLETAALRQACDHLVWSGETDLFIRPGHRFQVIDALLTNFHLPGSTLLVLVSAFAGYQSIRRAYAEAIERRYRFYSYGDCMLIGDDWG